MARTREVIPRTSALLGPSMFGDVDRLFDDLFNGSSRLPAAVRNTTKALSYPAINVLEGEAEYKIEAELPGFSMDKLDVQVTESELTLSGDYEETKEEKDEDKKYIHREVTRQSFRRSFALPTDIDTEKVEATFKDGVLHVTLPKSQATKPRKITLNS